METNLTEAANRGNYVTNANCHTGHSDIHTRMGGVIAENAVPAAGPVVPRTNGSMSVRNGAEFIIIWGV
jgi:hypothetical protein